MGRSSPEITLKYYAHMWHGADIAIAEEMSGNIKIITAEYTQIKFNRNQSIKNKRITNVYNVRHKLHLSLFSKATFKFSILT